jgi:glycerol-3-phosphate dehydrogenase (NAD(P)+)
MNIFVMGAGQFGTALGSHLAKKTKSAVWIWTRNESQRDEINQKHTNDRVFTDLKLPHNLVATCDKNQMSQADLVLLAVPTQSLEDCLADFQDNLKKPSIFVSTLKGIEINRSLFPSSILQKYIDTRQQAILQLSGPSFADEILAELPTAVSLACSNLKLGETVQNLFHTPFFRTYLLDDLRGLEVCGAMKNIIAIAAGAAEGLGFKSNSHAALITRGLAEMMRMTHMLGGKEETCMGLGGVGDLFLTCSSRQSRNFRLGYRLCSGEKVDEILKSMTSEGYYTVKAIIGMKGDLDLPICEEVYKVLYKKRSIQEGLMSLLQREMKHE